MLALLTIIFWGNVFRFSPGLIDRTYDTTADGTVIGRLTRAAADGFTSGNADLGVNAHPNDVEGFGLFQDQIKYFEHPELVDSLHLVWWPYAIAHHLNPFVTQLIFAPVGFNLTWSTSIPLLSLLALPLTSTMGPIAAFNLLCVVFPAL